MLSIRLTRCGRKNQPFYRIGVYDKRTGREGKCIEILGHYDPTSKNKVKEVNEERAKHWLSVGAKPSLTVSRIFVGKKVLPLETKPKEEKKVEKKRRKKKLSPERLERKAKKKAKKAKAKK